MNPSVPTSSVILDLNMVSFVVGVVSLITSVLLSWLAIWLSLRFKGESDRVNTETRALLMDIRTDAKSISAFMASEMAEYGKAGRQAMTRAYLGGGSTMSAESASVEVKDQPGS
jgi:hypothetical protein